MAVYLLTYDMDCDARRTALLGFLKHNYAWARLSESCYAIETDHPPSFTYSVFRVFLDRDDQLYVVSLALPAEGQGPQEVNAWLRSRLTWTPALAA